MATQQSLHPPPQTGPTRAKRHQVVVACDRCRARKTKCDGNRPTCTPCASHSKECRWSADPDASPMTALKRRCDSLNDQVEQHRLFTKLLTTGSNGEAQRALSGLRQGHSIDVLLDTAQDFNVITPEGDVSSEIPRGLGQPAFLSTSSKLLHARRMSLNDSALFPAQDRARLPSALLPPPSLAQRSIDDSYMRAPDTGDTPRLPNFARPDSRLERVTAKQWDVGFVDDNDLRDMLQSYFTWVHPSLLLFDKDIFLDDLVAGTTTEFCTPIIVYALIILGSKCYAHIDSAKAEASEHFAVARLKNEWDLAHFGQNPSSILASIALFLHHSWIGQDTDGYPYLAQALFLSECMGLYRPYLRSYVYSQASEHQRKTAGLKALAWGQYNLRANLSLICEITPLAHVPAAAKPAPGGDSSIGQHTDGDRVPWLSWPFDHTYRLSHAESIEARRGELSEIVSDVMPLHRQFEERPLCEIYLDNALHIFVRLRTWFDKLSFGMREPSELDHGSPQLIGLHNTYHFAVLELFRPFVVPPSHLSPSPIMLMQAGLPPDTALPAYYHARDTIRRNLSRLDHQYIPECPMLPLIVSPLMAICVDAMPHLQNDKDAQYFFLVGLKLGERMARTYRIFRFVLQALKAIAEWYGHKLDPAAHVIFDRSENAFPTYGKLDQVRSTLVVAACMRYRDGDAGGLETIVKKMSLN